MNEISKRIIPKIAIINLPLLVIDERKNKPIAQKTKLTIITFPGNVSNTFGAAPAFKTSIEETRKSSMAIHPLSTLFLPKYSSKISSKMSSTLELLLISACSRLQQ